MRVPWLVCCTGWLMCPGTVDGGAKVVPFFHFCGSCRRCLAVHWCDWKAYAIKSWKPHFISMGSARWNEVFSCQLPEVQNFPGFPIHDISEVSLIKICSHSTLNNPSTHMYIFCHSSFNGCTLCMAWREKGSEAGIIVIAVAAQRHVLLCTCSSVPYLLIDKSLVHLHSAQEQRRAQGTTLLSEVSN